MRKHVKKMLEREVVTGQEIAKRLKVHPSAIRNRKFRGTLDGVKKGKTWLYDIDDFRR